MTVLTAASPVSAAVFAILQDASLQAAIGGRLSDDFPEDVAQPCVIYEVLTEIDRRGLGTGGLPEIDLRTHVFTSADPTRGSLTKAQAINQQIVALLKDAAIDVSGTGYKQAGLVVYHETITLRDQELNGVKVHELVSLFTIWVEQT